MALRRVRLAGMGAAVAAGFAATAMFATPVERAQAQASSYPCRLAWEETTHGGDVLHTIADVQLGPIMRQADGTFVIMGQGSATITHTSGTPGCRTTGGSPFTARYMAVLSGAGDSAEVDIASLDAFSDEPVTVTCGAFPSQNRAGLSAPPTVTLELRDGASADYSNSEGAGIRQAGAAGTVTMHYCTAP